MHINSNIEAILTYNQNSFIDSETGEVWDFWSLEDIVDNLKEKFPNAIFTNNEEDENNLDPYLGVEIDLDLNLIYSYYGSPIWTLKAEK